ncbi:MAG: ATP-binding protein [Polyangiaceae bacterium]
MSLEEPLETFDGASSALGPRDTWPPRLAAYVDALRASASPMALAWRTSRAADVAEFSIVFNEPFRTMLGLDASLIGAHARAAFGPRWAELYPQFARAAANERGEHAGLSFAPIGGEGEDAGVLVTLVETPLRRFGSALVDTVIDQVPSGIVVVEAPRGRLVASNATSRFILGAPVDLEAGVEYLREPLMRALAGELVSAEEVSPHLLADGQNAARAPRLSLSAAPVRDAFGEVIAAVAVFTDISERVEAADLRQTLLERERQARAEAEEANRVKDEFLAMLGHELRNPLAPISTALELMRLRGDASAIRERAVIERQVEHLVRLVDDLLDISRITRGKVELKRSLVDMSDVVARAIELASPLIEQRQHNLRVEVPRGLVVMGDPTRLAQAVSNLLTNAAKYTDPGGNIAVEGLRVDASVLIRVTDDGRGLTPELSARVFELFFQERQALDRSQGGLGLGLAIVQTLVQAHGGSVMVSSDGPGLGSTFSIKLPEAVQRRAPARPSPRETPAPSPRAPRSRTVLVVDDNVDAAELLSLGLSAAGHRVEVAHDGPSALECARELKPEVAILDIGLPVMDGYELARSMLEQPALRECRLIAVTGYGLPADKERSREAGFVRHLVKPVSVERVLEQIDSIDEATP